MSEHTSTNTEDSMSYVVIFESPNGNRHATHLTFAEDDHPETLALDIVSAYKQHVNRFKRALYRGILLKKPVVSIVTLSGATDLSRISDAEQHFFIQTRVHDPTLSSAIRKPAGLRNFGRDAFCRQYKNVFLEADDLNPQSAILIHHIIDPTASKIVGTVGSILSLGLALLGLFDRFGEFDEG